MLSATDLAALMTAMAAVIGTLTTLAVRSAKKEKKGAPSDPLATPEAIQTATLRHEMEQELEGVHRKLGSIDRDVRTTLSLVDKCLTHLQIIERRLK